MKCLKFKTSVDSRHSALRLNPPSPGAPLCKLSAEKHSDNNSNDFLNYGPPTKYLFTVHIWNKT